MEAAKQKFAGIPRDEKALVYYSRDNNRSLEDGRVVRVQSSEDPAKWHRVLMGARFNVSSTDIREAVFDGITFKLNASSTTDGLPRMPVACTCKDWVYRGLHRAAVAAADGTLINVSYETRVRKSDGQPFDGGELRARYGCKHMKAIYMIMYDEPTFNKPVK